MKVTINRPTTLDAKYLLAKFGVRYWCDCKLSADNGENWTKYEDTDDGNESAKSAIPCINENNIGYGKSDYWVLKIDLDEGRVLGWPEGICIQSHFKVCDDGEYKLLDEDGKDIINITEEYGQYYVPYFFDLEDFGYGDYVYININGDGTIDKFDLLKERLESFLSEKIES